AAGRPPAGGAGLGGRAHGAATRRRALPRPLAPGAVMDGPRPAGTGREAGDRTAFLAPARRRLAGGVPANPVHPPPAPLAGAAVPRPAYRNLDPDDLVGTFARAVAEADGTCHVVEGDVPDDLLDRLVDELGGRPVVATAEPGAEGVARRLADRGVAVEPFTVEAAARAALGVTGAAAVALDSLRAGGRTASLLPPVPLCVVQVPALHPTPADVLRHLGDPGGGLPPSLVLVTGPSRTGDIEQLLTLGAHGPTALHVVLVLDGPGPASTRDGGARA